MKKLLLLLLFFSFIRWYPLVSLRSRIPFWLRQYSVVNSAYGEAIIVTHKYSPVAYRVYTTPHGYAISKFWKSRLDKDFNIKD